mmetsp:Transcript_80692/g.168284  ORF Transcript_80692/g.168284 Transcript_80692/m.168284 type:complete len:212 (+) Transcript_80692:124-759(+)|eukprot:CAMPEP_0206432994 /NCGR_PEP_ID=MMETSP0324_2-20121206/8274_1 /ASSEMBLY_ACC=CAM_ASM_000836 /TAXON_ID=2866 /ORGANISM="Crypthecodinium cohnii, Strain Seligo" /LENGTH=211 /DNA_ID=CAMNT_0053899185 /DNA_START=109 /DNA_END=744 /DNA_ORIENTATION=+
MGQQAGVMQGCHVCTARREAPSKMGPSEAIPIPVCCVINVKDNEGIDRELMHSTGDYWDGFFRDQTCEDNDTSNNNSNNDNTENTSDEKIPPEAAVPGIARPLLKEKHRGKRILNPTVEALLGAAQHGSVEGISRALAAGAELTSSDGRGWTALHWAAQEGHLSACSQLLNLKADPNAQTIDGLTPLRAAWESDPSFASKLQLLFQTKIGL